MIRVAIVGGGPKGLFAAERLVAHLAARRAEAEVTVFDPQPPGWGAGFRPDQPDWLRLNVNAAIVNADGGGPGRPSLGLSGFTAWRRAHGEAEPLDPFPPRELVGRYFVDSWHELLTRLPPRVTLRHRTHKVRDLTHAGSGWLIDGTWFDEVLLSTGHAQSWPGALSHGWVGPQPLVPQVYPVQRWLSPQRVPSGSTVVCRGAALTFIDAALTLTEGRGGRFGPKGYLPTGDEPARILPVGRRGGFLQVKPDPDGPLASLELTAARERGVRHCSGSVADVDAVLAAVWGTAADYLAIATGERDGFPPPGVVPPSSDDPVGTLRLSLQVALGRHLPGQEWALGQAWRDLHPAVVRAVGHQSVPQHSWPRFAAAQAALEPIGFGPPPINAAKLLALCDAGLVDVRYLGGDWTEAVANADVVIDCVLPPPGLVEGEWPDALVAAGVLVKGAGRRGVAVASDASCLSASGGIIPGLSALGRPTEDVVIGNDTLSRTLHPSAELWAERVAVDCAATVVAAR